MLDNSPLLIGVAANLSIVRGDKGRKRIILTLHTVYPTWTLLWLTVSAMQGRICCCRGKPMGTNDGRSARAVSQSVDLGWSNNPNTTPTKDYEMCEWWFTSAVSREDVLRRGRGDLHQQGDADRDAGYSWGTGVMEDEGDRGLDSS